MRVRAEEAGESGRGGAKAIGAQHYFQQKDVCKNRDKCICSDIDEAELIWDRGQGRNV